MDFAQTANQNGPTDPANLALRGADPLYSLPAGHLLRRSGIALHPTPGALVATLDNVKASEVEAALIPALRPDAALAADGFILRAPTPQKLEIVLAQLCVETTPNRLDANATFPSLAAFAAAVLKAVELVSVFLVLPLTDRIAAPRTPRRSSCTVCSVIF